MPTAKRTLWVAGAIAAVLILGLAFFFLRAPRAPLRFPLTLNGTTHWYALSGSTLSLSPGPLGFDGNPRHVYDAAQKLRSGDTPVLSLPKSGETVFGVVRGDGTFLPLVDDGAMKSDLAVNADGLAAYVSASASSSSIVVLSVFGKQNPIALGKGFSPVVLENGEILALSSEGLVRIDRGGDRQVLLSRPGLSYGSAAIAPGGGFAALPNAVTKQVDIFSIRSDALATSYVGSVESAPDALAFATPSEFVVHDAGGFSLYTIGAPIAKAATLTFSQP